MYVCRDSLSHFHFHYFHYQCQEQMVSIQPHTQWLFFKKKLVSNIRKKKEFYFLVLLSIPEWKILILTTIKFIYYQEKRKKTKLILHIQLKKGEDQRLATKYRATVGKQDVCPSIIITMSFIRYLQYFSEKNWRNGQNHRKFQMK